VEGNTAMSRKQALVLAIILFGLYFVAVAVFHGETPTPTPIDFSKLDFSKFTPAEIEATEKHRDQLKSQLRQNLDTVATVNTNQGHTLEESQSAIAATKKSFADYQAATEAQITKGNQAIAALDHVLKKLHLAKWILCGLWLAAVALVVIKLPILLKAYSLYIGGGLAIAGISAIWLWL
jgi:hypothetical protein